MRFLVLASALALAEPVAAQSLTKPLAHTGSPGDEVILIGDSLGGTTAVRFTANVGGVVGQMSKDVTPSIVTPSVLVCSVPEFNAFVPLGSLTPGSPTATVRAVAGTQTSNPVDFYLFEGHQPLGTLWTLGQGTTVSLPKIGRAVTTFDIFSDAAPITDNTNARVMIANAPAGAICALVGGVEAPQPWLMFGDGTLVADFASFVVVGTTTADSDGVAELPVPIKVGMTGTFVLQWGYVDPGDFDIKVSNALSTDL